MRRRTPAAPAITPEPRLDPAEAQAFTEQARWLHAYHDKRSDVVGQRAVTLFGFVSATLALLPAGFTLGKNAIKFTVPVDESSAAGLFAIWRQVSMSARSGSRCAYRGPRSTVDPV